MTKERLRQYRDRALELAQIKEKIEALEAPLYSPRSQRITGMPSGHGNGNPKEDLAIKHMELLDHYRELEAELSAEQLAVERAIDSLPPKARALLRFYYVDGLTWDKVCEKMHYSWTQVHRIHGRALEKLKEQEEPEA